MRSDVKNPQQTSTDGLVESFWWNRDYPPVGWKSIREFVRRAYLPGLSFPLARQLVDTSQGTVVVPWAFVLSNDEPSAKRTCRGYPLPRVADYTVKRHVSLGRRVLLTLKRLVMSLSAVVVCDDPDNLPVRIDFHKLASLRAFLIHVVKNDTGKSPHHIHEFKGEAWVCFKPSLEISAQGFVACDRA
jgi:hypothetical protein